ncbi:MAG: hypothetical protein IKI29_01370 [Clostridia bacterium]|nr:hypothetical protein [Clostridia bacterium]
MNPNAFFILMSAEQIKKLLIAIAEGLFDLFKMQGFFGKSQKSLHLASKRFAR